MFWRRNRFRFAAFLQLCALPFAAQAQTFESWWELGNTLYSQNRYAEAANALAQAVQLNDREARAWGLLGLCEFETGDYAHSLDHMQRALQMGLPAQEQLEGVLRFHAGMLLAHQGEFEKAFEAYRWFVKKGITHSEFLTALGIAALHNRELPERISAEQRDLYLAAGKAAFLFMAGAKVEAQQAFNDLIAHYPERAYVHYLYALFLMATDLDASVGEMRREVRISPASAPANAMLAWLLLERGESGQAQPFAEAAAKNDPALPFAQYVLGRTLLQQGKLQSSIEHLQTAEKSDPLNVETHMSLATAYARAGRPAEARAERIQTLQLWRASEDRANP